MSELQPNPEQEEAPIPAETPATAIEKGILFLVMAAVIAADQLTKYFIESRVELNHYWTPFPDFVELLKFSHVSNTGAAFGIFPSGSPVFMAVAIIVSIVIIIYNQRLPGGHVLYRVAFGLQLGGALGNLIDRFRIGHVTDFIDVGPVPVFNIADASIVVGTILLALLFLLDERAERASKKTAALVEVEAESGRGESAEEQPMLWNE